MDNDEIKSFLESIAEKSINQAQVTSIDEQTIQDLKMICTYAAKKKQKAIYTVIVTSLAYKYFNPEQDIRYHQTQLPNGYSGRGFDTKYITPFLQTAEFCFWAMAESGWLTRSLEQPHPYDKNYPGKITFELKNAFLAIIEEIQRSNTDHIRAILENLFYISDQIQKNIKANIYQISSLSTNSSLSLNISQVIQQLDEMFKNPKLQNKSFLPVLAVYSLYQCMMPTIARYMSKNLIELAPHQSSDHRSGLIGDICIKDHSNDFFEGVEIKYEKEITLQMIKEGFENKIKGTQTKRYYFLSTIVTLNEKEAIDQFIMQIKSECNCEIIVNGLLDTIQYYLRLLDSPQLFIDQYNKNLAKENISIIF